MKIEIKYKDELLAMIIKDSYSEPGISFFTEDHLSQQLAFMKHPQGKIIKPHVHNPIAREVHYTQEVLIIKNGVLRVDFYNDKKIYFESHIIEKGDVIILIKGGHGFEVLQDVEMIEVKQGPYAGDSDKTRFDPISAKRVKLVEGQSK
jgi:hypothetical protein